MEPFFMISNLNQITIISSIGKDEPVWLHIRPAECSDPLIYYSLILYCDIYNRHTISSQSAHVYTRKFSKRLPLKKANAQYCNSS